MLHWLRNLGLNTKIALTGVSGVLATAIALLVLAIWQSVQYHQLAQREVDGLIDTHLAHIAQAIYNLVEAEDRAFQEQVAYNLNVARNVLAHTGDVTLSRERTAWTAVNQFTEKSLAIELPKLLLGGRWLGNNSNLHVESPVVDDVTQMVGGTATIFQRMNDRGDMLRVATTVTNTDGRRAIGTYIPAVNPDNMPNPVIAAIMKGQTYHGRAFVVDAWYITAYMPITDATGSLVGMLYVGVPQKVAEARIRHSVLRTTVGKTGYVYVLSGHGNDRGRYIFSQAGERDGENIWDVRDSDGRYVVRSVINKATVLGPGEQATVRYLWHNPGETAHRWKVARIAYYEPWDWVIGVSTYEDELQVYRTVLGNGWTRMSSIMGVAGLALTVLVGLAGVLMAWTITKPVRAMTRAVETITHGDLSQRIPVRSSNELGTLARAFNTMTDRLALTIEGLKASEDKYRKIFANAIEGLFQATSNGRILNASPAMARIMGYDSPEDLMTHGTDLRQHVHVQRDALDAFLAGAAESNQAVEQEVQWYRKDRELIWVSISTQAVRDSDGHLLFLQGFLVDITERKRAEDELQKVTKLQSVILDNSTAGIALVRNRVFEWVNPRMTELFGLSLEECQGRPTRIIYPDDEAYRKVASVYPILAGGQKASVELQLRRGKDSTFWCRLEGKAVDPAHPEEGVIWTAEDVTERKRSEEEIQRVTKLQSVILDNSTAGIALVRNRVFEWVNPRMTELFGLSLEECQGRPTRIIYPDDEAYRKVASVYPILAGGQKASVELQLRRGKDSTFWCRLEGKAVDPTHPEEGVIWAAEDITERKRTEEAIAKRIVALTQPLDATEGVSFDDLFELADIQRIQDQFADATGVASIITRPDGTPITSTSNFCRLCNIIRQTEKGRRNCFHSDAMLGRCSNTGPIVQPCLSGGLWDAGAAIHVGGKHVANWLIGQVRDSTQSEDTVLEYARAIGANETDLLEAFREVPAMSRSQFDQIAQLLYAIASQLSAMAYQNVQQARFIADRQRAEKELRQHRDHLEELIRERTAELLAKNAELAADIAQRKQVEQALLETSNYLNKLLDCANAPIMVWDPQLRITRFNCAFEELTGRSTNEVLGRDLAVLFPSEHLSECLDQVRRATAGERWKAVEIPIQHVAGTVRVLLCNSACLYESDGKTVTSIIAHGQDITERKRLEAESLQHQKLESVGQLAAGIAHEINTPTQFVGDNIHFLSDAFTDLLKLIESLDQLDSAARELDLKPELLDDIANARTEADFEFLREEIPKAIAHSLDGIRRVSKIVNAMKSFSHPDVAEKTITDLNRAIETTATVARNEWKYVAEMKLELDPTLPLVPCFPGEINQVILNLIVNAAHAIAEKHGSVPAETGTITISTEVDGDMVEIRVSDTGTGISDEHRERMFTPFFTTKAVGKGTGQGLAMAYNVIHGKHGGTISFESEVGVGTTFIIRLPIADAEASNRSGEKRGRESFAG